MNRENMFLFKLKDQDLKFSVRVAGLRIKLVELFYRY